MQRAIIATLTLAAAFLSTTAHGQDDHGNSRATATTVAVPSDTAGTINPNTDEDYFRFTVSGTTVILMETTGSFDSLGRLWDSSGTQLTQDDDSGAGQNFRIRRSLTAGTYYVSVESPLYLNTGSYTLQLRGGETGRRIQPTLNLTQTGRTGTLSLSIEALSGVSGRTITVDDVTYHTIYDREMYVAHAQGVSGRSGRQIFARLDFENMVFLRESGSPVRGILSAGADFFTHTIEAGGTNGDAYAVLSLPPNTAYTAGAVGVLSAFYIHAGIRPDAPGAITYTEYINVGDALQGRNPLHTQKRTVVFPVRSLKDDVYPGVATATVASNFTQLAAAGENAIGTLSIAVGDDRDGYTHHGPTSYRIGGGGPWYITDVDDLTDIAQPGNPSTGRGSLITFRGDFSVGSFYANTAAAASCGTVPLTTRANNAVLDEVSFAAAEGVTSLCVAVPANNTAEIPEGEYTVEVDYEGLPNRAYPPIDMAETSIGRIRRDGTRVQIPFLTTYAGYRQRVVIVNRNAKPVAYTFKFVAEDGVTATPGDMAVGTVPAKSRVLLRATDIVSLEGGKTRTAATLDVVAGSGTVDVATTTVNMEDKGTDTVVLESIAN